MADQTKDTRVVEMQFDSRDFDKNIRKSSKTLEDFKKQLNFDDTVRQMQEVDTEGNNILQNMAKNIQKLTTELTGIGSVSTFVAQRIKGAWQGAIQSVEGFAKSLTTAQQAQGRVKYDGLLKAVQTIKNATGDSEEYVYSVMEKLNHYTDETSYNFSDMANNIGKFTTAGVNLADAEKEMEGIANWAALAGQGVSEAQRAMYNISQAMSAGSMRLMDYRSIQNANMDIRKFRQEALDAAVAAGTLKKSRDGIYKTVKGGKTVNLDKFTETLQYGWFDKKTMEIVFKTFADNTKGIGEEAYKAAQRCVTMKDALDAIKDMLSTGWMQTYQHIFGKLTDAMNLFSGLCVKASDALSQFIELRNGILERWSYTGRDSLWGALVGEIESPDGKTLFKGAYGLLDVLTDLGDEIHNAFTDFVLRFVDVNNRELYRNNPEKMYDAIAAKLSLFTKSILDFTTAMGHFFHDIPVGQTESRMDQIRHIVEAVYASIMLVVQVISGIGQFIGEVIAQMRPAGDAILYLLGYISQLFTGKVVAGAKKNAVGNFFHMLAEMLRPLTSIVNLVVPALVNVIGKVIEFVNATGLLQPALIALITGKIVGLLGALNQRKGILGFIGNLFGGKFGGAAKIVTIVSALLGLVQKFTGINVGKGAIGLIQNLFGNAKKQIPALKANLKIWGTTIKATIKQWIADMKVNGPAFGNTLKSKATAVFEIVKSFFSEVVGKVIGLFTGSAAAEDASNAVNKAVIDLVTPGSNANGSTSNVIAGATKSLKERLQAFWAPIASTFSNFFNVTIPNFFKSPAMQAVKKFFSGTTLMGLLGGVTNLLKWLAIFRSGSGLVKIGKGVGKLGKGIGIFGKNLKNLNLAEAFKNMFNFTNIVNSNNVDNSRTSNWKNFGNGLLKVAAAFGIVVYAAIKLGDAIGKMKPDQLKMTGIALGALIGALVAADIATKKFGGGGSGVMKLAIGIGLLLIPLSRLMNMPWESADGKGGFLDGFWKLATLLGTVALAARIAGGKGAKGLVGMAVGLNLLMIPLRQLMGMKLYAVKDDGTWDPNGGGLGQALIALGILMTEMGAAARIGNGKKLKGMLSFAIALNLIVRPLRKLADMNTQQYLQGVIGISTIIGVLAGLVYVAKDTKLASLAGVVGAITALSFIGTLIGAMPWQKVVTGFAPIILMITSMAWLVREAGKLDTEKIKGMRSIFTTFAVTIGIIAGSLVALTVLDVKESTLIEFFAGLILTLGSMGVMIKMAKKTDAKGIGKIALVFGVFTAVVLSIAGSLIAMTKMGVDWKMLVGFMAGLSLLIVVMGFALPKLAKMDFKGIIVAAGGMALATIAIMGAISLMAKVLLGAVGGALETISARLKTTSGLLKGFFDRMQTITEESVKHAGVIFDGLKDIITKFIGFGDHSGDIQAVMSQLNMLGTGLDLFFVNEAKYPNPEESKSFKILNKFIEIGPSLAAFNVGSLPAQLMYLGVGLGLFNSATKDIPDGEVPALALLQGIFGQADNIEKFTKLPLDSFRSQMSGLGGAMSLYAKGAKEVTGINAETDAPDITDAIGILGAVAKAMSGEGENALPSLDNIPDETKLGLFAGQLEALGTALSTYAAAAQQMETNTDKALALLKFLGEIGGYVTPENLGVVNRFTDAGISGGSDGPLGQFALDIGALGTALSTFASDIGGKDAEFTTGLGVLDRFKELNQKLTKDKLAFVNVFKDAGMQGNGTTNTVLGQFSNDIGQLGHALASFAQNVAMDEGGQADFNNAIRALNFMSIMGVRLDKIKVGTSLHTLIHGEGYTLGAMADDMQILGQSLKDMSIAMSGAGENGAKFDYEAVTSGLGAIESMVRIANQVNSVVPETGEWISVGDIVSDLAMLFHNLNDTSVGGAAWANGFGENSIISQIAIFAKNVSDAFSAAGEIDMAALAGFADIADGITSLMSVDPTLSFEGPGEAIISGMMTGMENKEGELMEHVTTLMAQISTTMAENTDLLPTITPVLDLTQVERDAATIGGYLEGYSLDLANALIRANQSNNEGPVSVTVTNPTDLSGVVGKIELLQTEISGLKTAIDDMQVVLDTGAVVGGIIDGVDAKLGLRGWYAGRRQ